jgi:hypothetical protein
VKPSWQHASLAAVFALLLFYLESYFQYVVILGYRLRTAVVVWLTISAIAIIINWYRVKMKNH